MTDLGIINFFGFVVATIGIILLPGPNSMYVLTTSAQRGIKKGFQGALGVLVGDFILILLTVFGAATVMREAPSVFVALKVAGALYLAYLGLNMLWGAYGIWGNRHTLSKQAILSQAVALEPMESNAQVVSNHVLSNQAESPFKKALLISLLNPKAILFLLSFFIQAVSPDAPQPLLAFLVLGVILQFTSWLYLSTLVLVGDGLAQTFRSKPLWMVVGTAAVGLLFVGFAVRLAFATIN